MLLEVKSDNQLYVYIGTSLSQSIVVLGDTIISNFSFEISSFLHKDSMIRPECWTVLSMSFEVLCIELCPVFKHWSYINVELCFILLPKTRNFHFHFQFSRKFKFRRLQFKYKPIWKAETTIIYDNNFFFFKKKVRNNKI